MKTAIMKKVLCGAFLYCGMLAGLSAGVAFDEAVAHYAIGPEVEELTVTFPFKNKGLDPVRIVSIISGCDCLLAHAPEAAIEPGESGEVTALFKVGSYVGEIRRVMSVVMESNGRETSQSLEVVIDIPLLFKVEPNALTWVVGDEAEPQVIDFKVLADDPIELVGVVSSQPAFEVRIETVEEGRHYQIHVQPEDTGMALMSLLQLRTNSPYPKYSRHSSFATIRPN